MGSDRARVSYDPKQQYRSVVMQQGRVTLEADFNEELAIAGEELREETLDIVGPSGTPDNGYLITPLTPPSTPPFDFSVRPGTMYVGGLRVTTPPPAPVAAPAGQTARLIVGLRYSAQTDWLDYSDDTDWVDTSKNPPTNEFVYLFLREQEVSAVEDSDLKDVALGGPDTAQRTRLIQHIVRLSDGQDCATGLLAARNKWKTEGLGFDPRTMQLVSTATLKVSFNPSGPPPDPCNPQAQGGYLGADNQLIRVQISGIDQATGNPKFVWGFDDASFLYRLDLDKNNKQLLHLQSRPVDASHNPWANQAVEALRSAAELSNGEYVASLSGSVFTLDKDYNPDTQMITLPAPLTQLPDEYYDSSQTPRVFLRVWEEELVFTPDTPVNLGNTGLQVTFEVHGNVFHTGDYWLFAVRPTTPQEVYPERYLADFQPPEGPRMWACPLGVIGWNQQVGTLLADCRNPFDNLVNLTKRQQGCCTISVRPEDLTTVNTLQSIVDRAARITMNVSAADPGSAGNNISVSISNVQVTASSSSFDLGVTETNVYLSLSAITIAGILGIPGDPKNPGSTPGLAHLVAAPATGAIPVNNQTVSFAGGQSSVSAQASFLDATGNVAFTLEAKKPGLDGNLTTATISNVQASGSFTLGLTWTKTLTGLTLGNFLQNIQSDLAYEITATPPAAGMTLPAEGVTTLSGGTDATPGAGGAPATAATGVIFGNPVKICLRPGNYRLSKALVLSQQHSNLTIEGCPGGVTISVAKGQEKEGKFVNGLIHLTNAQNLTLRDLTFEMPLIAFFESGGTLAGLGRTQLQSLGETALLTLAVSVGLTAAGCQGLTIEHCNFDYPVPQPGTILFAAGILAAGDCSDLRLGFSNFQGPDLARALATGALALAAGYLQTSIVQPGVLVPSTLFNASFSHNVFENLDIGLFLFAPSFGITTFESNVMRACLVGILTGFTLNFAAQAVQAPALAARASSSSAMVQNLLASKLIQQGISVAASYPLPASYVPQRKLAWSAVPATTDATGKKVSAPQFVIPKGVQPLAAHVLQAASNAVDTVAATNASFFGSSVNFTGNDIDAFIADSTVGGPAIFVIALDKEGSGVVNMTANKLRNNSASVATALLAGTVACAVTGNLIENRQIPNPTANISPNSLVVDATPVAITGNVLVRPALYPMRTGFTPALQPPFNSWDFMNTVIP